MPEVDIEKAIERKDIFETDPETYTYTEEEEDETNE